jgi:hypothetical protein
VDHIVGESGGKQDAVAAYKIRAEILRQTNELRDAYLRYKPDDEDQLPELTEHADDEENLAHLVTNLRFFQGVKPVPATIDALATPEKHNIGLLGATC